MMKDMEQLWSEFIRDVLSSNIFGFSVHEKVYRKRYKSNGSLYDDGLVGWKNFRFAFKKVSLSSSFPKTVTKLSAYNRTSLVLTIFIIVFLVEVI